MTDRARSTPWTHAEEMAVGARFGFGANWARFLERPDASRIQHAERSLLNVLDLPSLEGLRFPDAGSGGGLFSLAALRLGATVHAFDCDPQSVACARELRRRYGVECGQPVAEARWRIEEGSVLDTACQAGLGDFDIVYSWGVLHHTGDQWSAMNNVGQLVRPRGRLFVSICNDQGSISRWWMIVKRLYSRNALARAVLIALYTPYFVGLRWLYRIVTGRGKLERGMSQRYDMIDWLRGWPFQVASPEQVFRFFAAREFELRAMTTAGHTGTCNEFVFERAREAQPQPGDPRAR